MEDLLLLLGEHRAREKPYWLSVGQVIHSLTNGKGLALWVKFSGKHHDEKECTEYFNSWNDDHLTAITLQQYAREDNPQGYQKWLAQASSKLVKGDNSAMMNAASVAALVLAPDFAFDSKQWYHLEGHRLVKIDKEVVAVTLIKEVEPIFRYLHQSSEDTSEYLSPLAEILKKLDNIVFRINVIKACQDKLFHIGLKGRIDVDPATMAWTNGISECLDDQIYFRPGKLEDFITLSTGQTFPLTEPPEIKELRVWLNQTFPEKELEHYFLKLAASTFLQQRGLCIWYGNGNNGRSCIGRLFGHMLGNYCLFIGDFREPIPERPEHIIFGYLEEGRPPKHLNKFNRFFHTQDTIPFVPLDKLPEGVVLPFLSTWSSLEDSVQQRQFKSDPNFDQKIPNLAPAFAWLCVQYYPIYKKEGLVVPEFVLKELQQHAIDHDPITLFQKEVNLPTDAKEAYKQYKEWHKENLPGVPLKLRQEFRLRMKETLPLPKETETPISTTAPSNGHTSNSHNLLDNNEGRGQSSDSLRS